MAELAKTTDVATADELYAALVALYEGLDERESARASARLVVLLASHIGDGEVLREAVGLARGGPTPSPRGGAGPESSR